MLYNSCVYNLPWHLACHVNPQGLALLWLPAEKMRKWLDSENQHMNNNKKRTTEIQAGKILTGSPIGPMGPTSPCSPRSPWGVTGQWHGYTTEVMKITTVFQHVSLILTALPAGPIVPGRPGWPESPCAEASIADVLQFKKRNWIQETTNDI